MKRGFLILGERIALAWEGLCLTAEAALRRSRPVLDAQWARSTARPLVWGSVYTAIFCVLGMIGFDRPAADWFKAHVTGEWEGFFKTVTHLGEAQLYLVPAGILWLGLMIGSVKAGKLDMRQSLRRLSYAPGFLFSSMAISGLTSNAVKIVMGRMRPRYWFDQGLYGFEPFNTHWGMNSFPSGHTQAAFAAMTALMVILPRHAALWLTIAFLVAASRFCTTVHWMSDTAAGAWLAIVVTVLLARWFRAKGWNPEY